MALERLYSALKTVDRVCNKCKGSFPIVPQEIVFYEKKKLPFPDMCPDCRMKRRLHLRNEQKLYPRNCDKCNKEIVSVHQAKSKFIVYCEECYADYVATHN